ncbi:3-hydroxyacyl-CoA dehydrogenase [Inhella gelatinilytica]|uniref:3-hydroxyacyl-CoA dehydrogenase n=1 Tax=Inhella gelatinilytica TaxID=2795030 RepID=A0A931IYG3_9BURK|nr:3-hydroxyacyl-CoA dehydrogenase [Inhella gelatinilytica]MBH9553916.1 3-hydroxyacyl-CoA dehydrogenase [Inhella gelatinilytica]
MSETLHLGEGATIGLVGTGVMGMGIAQIAALAGHPVKLLDAREGAAAAGVAKLADTLASLVTKGKLTADAREQSLGRLKPVAAVADLADCALVIEVIVELLEPKRALLRELDALLPPTAVIASNTSSISITALANGLAHPQRLVGMHFFNPVPLMKLVEVVSGLETAPEVAEGIDALARRWGKVPVKAASTPGFIVNRIARPYYAETLALLQEQAGTPAELDACLRSVGFRMGPCELMDLIGQDTNNLVTRSVWESNFGDRRYQPSLVQQALVDGGRLGRKVGKGFYVGEPTRLAAAVAPPSEPSVVLMGRGPCTDALAARLPGVARQPEAQWTGLRVGDGAVDLMVTDGRCAVELAAGHSNPLAVLDWCLPGTDPQVLALAWGPRVQPRARQAALDALAAAGLLGVPLRDTPGLVVARTVAMLINEGADAVWQGVCDESGADTAMKLGVNYPAGPFEWLKLLGVVPVCGLLDRLWAHTRSERYRVSPYLRQRYWLDQER